MARSFGAAALGFMAISLAFPSAAHAFAIHSFAPADVTLGTRLVIKGDFAELAASGEQPKVVGTRMDTPRTVNFQVLTISRRTIIAKVRSVPSSKADPAAGKTWSLRVRSPGAGRDRAGGRELHDRGAGAARALRRRGAARPAVALFALDPGQAPSCPTVLVGRKKAKVLGLAPEGPSPDDDPWRVSFRAPNLRNGFYPVRLENALGRSARFADLLIFGGLKGGLVPPRERGDREPARAGGTALQRERRGQRAARVGLRRPGLRAGLELAFEPDPAGGYQPAAVSLRESAPRRGAARVGRGSGEREARSLARVRSRGRHLRRGAAARGQLGGPLLRMRGYFQAPLPESFAAR